MSFIVRSQPDRNDDDRSGIVAPHAPAAPVDFYLSVSHDLFAIGALHRAQAQAFNVCLHACQERKPSALGHALSKVRANAQSIAGLTKALESKLNERASDNYENSPQVYGSVK